MPTANESSPLLARPNTQQSPVSTRRRRLWGFGVPLVLGIVFVFVYQLFFRTTYSGGVTTSPASSGTSPSGVEDEGNGDATQVITNGTLDPVMTMLPPFDVEKHLIPPRLLAKQLTNKAVPTHAFWTNFLIGDDHGQNVGAGEVTLSPYTVRSMPNRLEISYGDDRRVASDTNITEYFNVDVALAGYKSHQDHHHDPGATKSTNPKRGIQYREVVNFDPLSVTLQFYLENETAMASATKANASAVFPTMTALLARGSPFVTVEYEHGVLPVLEFNSTIVQINGVPVQVPNDSIPTIVDAEPKTNGTNGTIASNATKSEAPQPGTKLPPIPLQNWTASRFEIDMLVYGAPSAKPARQKWLVFFETERTLALEFVNQRTLPTFLKSGARTTPTNFRLVDQDFYTGAMRVAVVPTAKNNSKALVQTLDKYAGVYPINGTLHTDVNATHAQVHFCWSTKIMRNFPALYEDDLLMAAFPHHVEALSKAPSVSFNVLQPFGHRTLKSWMTTILGKCWTMDHRLSTTEFDAPRAINPKYLEAVRQSLHVDANYTPTAVDPYFFGKEISRQARLALIADTLQEVALRDKILTDLENWTKPWLMAKNNDTFVYDKVWGGICSRNGLKGVFWMTDFGNGWYNDHHFHYGYLLYSLAVIGKYRPEFVKTHRAAITGIVRDIANPNLDDSYFPLTRHFSWFDGHSFASGVFTLDGGKSQESVSEAINAYYGVYLLGKVMQLEPVEKIGHLLTSLEMEAALKYWQMPSYNDIYEPVYAQNKMTGMVGCTKVVYTTWFGPEVEHMHLINMMPFTPIAEEFLQKRYIEEEYPVLLAKAFPRVEDPMEPRWKGYAYLAQAILNPDEAWKQLDSLNFFDDGNSRTASYYWIATRP